MHMHPKSVQHLRKVYIFARTYILKLFKLI